MDLFSPAMRRDPYPLYDQLRATSPVLHLPGPDLWVVFGHDAVKRALSDHEAFSSNVGPSRGNRFEWLLFMDPPRHTQLRAIIGRAFGARSIAGLAPRIRALASELLDRVGDPDCDRGELDLVADLAAPLPMMVIAELLGLPTDDWRRLAGWSEAIVNLGNTIAGGDAGRAAAEFARADAEMTGYLAAVIAARRDQPTGDLISRLATAEPGGEALDDPAITRFCQLLLAAGTETTTNLIDNAVLCFAAHPDQLAAVRARPDLLPHAIEEVLRYKTPVQAMFRTTRCAVELDGTRIPAGAFVIAMIGAANRDPGRFAEPGRFDVARAQSAPGIRPRHPLLPRRTAVAARGRHRARRAVRAVRAARAGLAGLAAARVVPRPRPRRAAGAVPPRRIASTCTPTSPHPASRSITQHTPCCAGLRAPQNAPRRGRSPSTITAHRAPRRNTGDAVTGTDSPLLHRSPSMLHHD